MTLSAAVERARQSREAPYFRHHRQNTGPRPPSLLAPGITARLKAIQCSGYSGSGSGDTRQHGSSGTAEGVTGSCLTSQVVEGGGREG